MKNIKIYILAFLTLVISLVSCYEDKSIVADIRYPDLVANMEGEEELVANFGSLFEYSPQLGVLDGKDTVYLDEAGYEDYMYEWRLALTVSSFDTLTQVIAKDRNLSLTMDIVQPNSSAYTLILRATNKDTGLSFAYDWDLKVLSDYGQGILIAETDDDLESDISLLMTRAYNENFDENAEDIIHRNTYSKINNSKLSGVVNEMTYMATSSVKSITALVKGEALYTIDPITYEPLSNNEQLFFYTPEVFNPQKIGNYGNGASYLLNNGVMHYYELRYGMKYSYVPDPPYVFGENMLIIGNSGSYYFGGHCFGIDQNTNNMVAMDNYGRWKEYPSNETGEFDPANMAGLEMIYGDIGTDYWGMRRMLMRETASGKFYVYQLEYIADVGIVGTKIFDLASCDGIENATSYAFSAAFDEFYYAVGNELASCNINTPSPSYEVSYATPLGEDISNILIHKFYGKTTWSEEMNDETGEMEPFWRDSENNVITVASYDAAKGEGFIRTLPIQYGGRGGIAAEKYVKTYGGFARITAIAYQR